MFQKLRKPALSQVKRQLFLLQPQVFPNPVVYTRICFFMTLIKSLYCNLCVRDENYEIMRRLGGFLKTLLGNKALTITLLF